jgi:carboxylesterase
MQSDSSSSAAGAWAGSDTMTLRAPFSYGQSASRGARAKSGILLVHGFTGTPFEMHPMGRWLADGGWSQPHDVIVHGPLLRGHGSTTADLAHTTWNDWYESLEQAYLGLAKECERVAVCGLSLGGLLTLELARRQPQIAAIAVLAAPLWLYPNALMLRRGITHLPLLKRLGIPKLAGGDIADPIMRRLNKIAQAGAWMPFAPIVSLMELGEYLQSRLGEIKTPTFLMHSKHDHTVPFACMGALERALGDACKGAVALQDSYHVITIDVERQRVFEAVRDHFATYLLAGA